MGLIFGGGSSGPASCPAGLATNLDLYWKLDETSGAAVADSSSGGLNAGTANGGFAFAAGKLNNGIDLNGTTGFIQCDTTFFDPSAGAFSIAAWVRADTVGQVGAERVIAHQLDGTGLGRTLLSSTAQAATKLSTAIGGTTLSGATTLVIDTWYHVCLTVSAAGARRLYLDGSLDGGPNTDAPEACDGAFLIGKHKTGTAFWDGIIDDVRVYGRELSSSDVSDLYNAGAGCVS